MEIVILVLSILLAISVMIIIILCMARRNLKSQIAALRESASTVLREKQSVVDVAGDLDQKNRDLERTLDYTSIHHDVLLRGLANMDAKEFGNVPWLTILGCSSSEQGSVSLKDQTGV